MRFEESNLQCPECGKPLFFDDQLNTVMFVLYCKGCVKYWEIIEDFDPESGEELEYIIPYDKTPLK